MPEACGEGRQRLYPNLGAGVRMTSEMIQTALEQASHDAHVFAVVDAAHFDHLQDDLIAARLRFDPLYLDEIDDPSIASGPHLVHPTGPRQIARIRALTDAFPACVWWCWPDMPNAGEAIHRHLRSLAMAEIPVDRFDAATDHDEQHDGWEAVLLRHGDANVMMDLLPILYDAQIARVFGDAEAIMIAAPQYGTIRTFERPAGLPPPERSMLRLDHAQYEAFGERRLEALRPIVEDYLVRALPQCRAEQGSPDFDDGIMYLLRLGRSHGLRAVRAYCRWTMMNVSAGIGSPACERLAAAIQESSLAPIPDGRMDRLYTSFARKTAEGRV